MIMADNDSGDMSMDEILSSIRKYVTSDAQEKAPEKKKAAPPPADASSEGVIRLEPLCPRAVEEEVPTAHNEKENIAMPRFFQKAAQGKESVSSEQTEPALDVAEQAPQYAEEKNEPAVHLTAATKNATLHSLDAFQEKARAILQQNQHKALEPDSLDSVVQRAAVQAVTEWVNLHLPAMVEDVLEREIQKLMEGLANKG